MYYDIRTPKQKERDARNERIRSEFQKMKSETRVKQLFFTKTSFLLLRWVCRYPRIVRWVFYKKMRQEFWIGN